MAEEKGKGAVGLHAGDGTLGSEADDDAEQEADEGDAGEHKDAPYDSGDDL